MQKLLQLLQHGTLPSRASAAASITDLLEKFSISSIPEVWYLARDLCDSKYQSSIRRVALKLMIKSMLHDDDSVSTKLMFYKDIVTYCYMSDTKLDPEFDLFLKALRTLTNDGREIHDLCIYNQSKNLIEFVVRAFTALSKRAKSFSRVENPDDKHFRDLTKTTQFLRNCVKFNFSLLEVSAVSSILSVVNFISNETNNETILLDLVDLVKAIIVFGNLPNSSESMVINILCLLSSVSDEVDAICWSTMSALCSEAPLEVVRGVCEVLTNPQLAEFLGSDISDVDSNVIGTCVPLLKALGAIRMLERLIVFIGSEVPSASVDHSFGIASLALEECLTFDIPVINSGLLRMLDRLLSVDDHRDNIRSETIFSVIFPFRIWYSPSGSLFTLLLKFKLNTPQDSSYWCNICTSIYDKYRGSELSAPKERLVDLFMEYPHKVTEPIVLFTLNYYRECQLCSCLNPLWKEHSRKLLRSFYFSIGDVFLPSNLRIDTLKVIKESCDTSFAFGQSYSVSKDIIFDILHSALFEKDDEVMEYVMKEFLLDFILSSTAEILKGIFTVFEPLLQLLLKQEQLKSIVSLKSLGSAPQNFLFSSSASSHQSEGIKHSNSNCLKALAETLCQSFLLLSIKNVDRAAEIYDFMIRMLQLTLKDGRPEILIILLRPLVRIRSTQEGRIYFTTPSEMEGLATALKKNTLDEKYEATSSSLWTYPEDFDYLPVNCFNQLKGNLKIFSQNSARIHLNTDISATIDIAKWLNIVINIMEEYYHWELYSFIWAHFCTQLSNMRLMEGLEGLVSRIRKIICEQTTLNLPKTLMFPLQDSKVTKGDLQVAFIRSMSSLIGYHDFFTKPDEDHIVSSLLFALGSWEKTAIPSIHMLTICCYEIPASLKKYLIPILTRLQAGVTSAFASPSIIEFLLALIHVPTLTSNFTIEEFKRVFAISFKYIEHSTDLKSRDDKSSAPFEEKKYQSHGIEAEVDKNISTLSTTISPILREYVLFVSHIAIVRWFLKISLGERSQVSGFIVKNLILSSSAKDIDLLNDVTVAFLDFVTRYTFSDIPLRVVTSKKSNGVSQRSSIGQWIIGHSVVSIDCDVYTGDSTVSIRRPSGVSVFDVKLDPSMMPQLIDQAHPIVLSSYFFLQLFKPMDIFGESRPLALLDDAATERALNTLDRISFVAQHKAGIVYIGPGQLDEVEILSNKVGSSAYHHFLDGVGRLIRLKDADTIYLGGLDKENGTDGEFAYIYNDPTVSLVYHVTTLMPNMSGDKYCSMKKRHIGNNYVNVFFDESGLPFNFNVIKSQFNFLNIVISPHTISTGIRSSEPKYYKVKSYRRSGVPGIFSTSHFKLISAQQLPHLVRNIVLMSDRFATIWHHTVDGTFQSNWALRVKHIKTLRTKTAESHNLLREEQQKSSVENRITKGAYVGAPDTATSNMAQSFLEQLHDSPAAMVKASSLTTFDYPTETDSTLYKQLEFNSFA